MYVLVSGRTLSINFVERLVKGARVCGVQLIPRGKLYSRRQANAEVELWLAPAAPLAPTRNSVISIINNLVGREGRKRKGERWRERVREREREVGSARERLHNVGASRT